MAATHRATERQNTCHGRRCRLRLKVGVAVCRLVLMVSLSCCLGASFVGGYKKQDSQHPESWLVPSMRSARDGMQAGNRHSGPLHNPCQPQRRSSESVLRACHRRCRNDPERNTTVAQNKTGVDMRSLERAPPLSRGRARWGFEACPLRGANAGKPLPIVTTVTSHLHGFELAQHSEYPCLSSPHASLGCPVSEGCRRIAPPDGLCC